MRGHYTRLGDVYAELAQYECALDAYERSGTRGPAHQARIARILALMGRDREATVLLEKVADDEVGQTLSLAAAAHVALGDTDKTSRLLARSISRDDPGLPYFPVDPRFATLRRVPQWPELLRRTGFSVPRRQ